MELFKNMILSRKMVGGTTYVWKLKPLVLKQLQAEVWLVLNSWTSGKRLIRHFLLSLRDLREIQYLHHLVSCRRKILKEEVSLKSLLTTQLPEQPEYTSSHQTA